MSTCLSNSPKRLQLTAQASWLILILRVYQPGSWKGPTTRSKLCTKWLMVSGMSNSLNSKLWRCMKPIMFLSVETESTHLPDEPPTLFHIEPFLEAPLTCNRLQVGAFYDQLQATKNFQLTGMALFSTILKYAH